MSNIPTPEEVNRLEKISPDGDNFQERNSEEGLGGWNKEHWTELEPKELDEVLSLTIKKDQVNKTIVFLVQLLAYTERDQFNISFNAPSASGKSYIALEIASLFPEQDVLKISYASPTAFYHSNSKYNKETKKHEVDLERKILIFIDMPHFQLLERLRSLLSHDEKEILAKITDRNRKGQNRAKDIVIKGFPSVIFASASFKLDEQELTRFLLLSPETNYEKSKVAIEESLKRVADFEKYFKKLNENTKRKELLKRIEDIRRKCVEEIIIHDPDKLLKMFKKRHPFPRSRHARDVKRIASLAKGWALLNLWTREFKDGNLRTKDRDLIQAFNLWDEISLPQELGLPPYIFNLYKEVIYPAYKEKGVGLERKDIQKAYYKVYQRQLPDWKLRQEIIPMLEVAGVIYQEDNPDDKRVKLVFPALDPASTPTPSTHINFGDKEEMDTEKSKVVTAEEVFEAKAEPTTPSEEEVLKHMRENDLSSLLVK